MPVAEALLGTQILEDLGVPEKFLGAATQLLAAQERAGPMSAPRTIRWFVAKHIGLMPLAALVMLFIFLIYFRNGLAVLLPLPGVVATLLFVFGLMGWFGVPIYLTAAVMPVLLVVLSVTNDIYLFNRYFRLLRENPPGITWNSSAKLLKNWRAPSPPLPSPPSSGLHRLDFRRWFPCGPSDFLPALARCLAWSFRSPPCRRCWFW